MRKLARLRCTAAAVLSLALVACAAEEDPLVDDVAVDEQGLAEAESGFTAVDANAACTTTIKGGNELMIRAIKVVEDPVRTVWTGATTNPDDGAWQFGRLMTNMAGTGDPSAFTLNLFKKWKTTQTVNMFGVPARTAINAVIDNWPRIPGTTKIDLTKAPLRLLAIVNRIDLRNLAQGNAGEGRFVFGVLDQLGNPMSFTVILEYKLPASTAADVARWANDWHALGALTVGSPAYNLALRRITDRFAGKNVAPSRPNGSSISQIRTNEVALSFPWELRQFEIDATTHQLVEVALTRQPADQFDNTAKLATFINNNEAKILAGTHQVPLTFQGAAFRAGSILNNIDFWSAPGIRSNRARHLFSVNTCDGCHGGETATFGFLHVFPRGPGQVSELSGFLTGIDVPDPVTGATRRFNDLGRRATDLKNLVCTPTVAATTVNERVH